ncbi:OLC1v1003440C1 [Oldenlandia corymbosa var. corymbosa]|uniref:OLC1v1003440C1 n=1 Tax=Oldenlandia corymbosa var. corymbosa TaxID=529605 RepID=A0AAV1DA18_OLDCO|nr:OLC1v1003440C1 [Oldenlandia corymbosa var. corymbosa]
MNDPNASREMAAMVKLHFFSPYSLTFFLLCCCYLVLFGPTTTITAAFDSLCSNVDVLEESHQQGFQVEESTIEDIQRAFASKKLTSTQLVDFYLNQIETLNPILRAVIEVNPDARDQAADADRTRDGSSSMLHGIPVLLKDSIDTKDKLNTTAGSYALLGSKVARDAGVVERLRKAGAVILGKSSMTEWYGLRDLGFPEGWCARSGQGSNPYVLGGDPSGSSSGSAISVAANMVAVSLGTETDGSILCPADFNSVVGFKPTVGLTSRAGVIPVSTRQDSIGPICRTVSDAVHVLDAIVGFDPRDFAATKEAAKFIPIGGYKQFLKLDGLVGKRLGVVRNPFVQLSNRSNAVAVLDSHLQKLRHAGATIIDDLEIPDIDVILDPFQSGESLVMLSEFKLSLNDYLQGLTESPVRSLAEIIAFNENHPDLESCGRLDGQNVLIAAEFTNGIGEEEKQAMMLLERLCKDGFEELMLENDLDAVVTIGSSASMVLAIGGYPAITVPASYDIDGMPFGILFAGLKGMEPKLIEAMMRVLLLVTLVLSLSFPNHYADQGGSFSFKEATVSDIRIALDENKLTSRELVEFYLKEIRRQNPVLKSVIEVNPDALKLSDEADAQRKASKPGSLSPLAGIPILLKDNIATKDKLNTTAGSYALLRSIVPQDAGVVKRLRKAGAIILGKASMTEWAAFRSLSMPNGWNARLGQTVNPYVKSADPCGSSTGSAVSVAANLAAVSLGTETSGSILCPSSSNSIVGIKPTVGLTSRAGVVPISPRQDTVGPICRTLTDAVVVLDVIVGYDPDDALATKKASKYIPKGGYLQFLKRDGLQGKRLGILRYSFVGFDNDTRLLKTFAPHFKTLRQRGAILVDIVDTANFDSIVDGLLKDENTALYAEFKPALNAYLSRLVASTVGSLSETIAFNNKHFKLEKIKGYGQDIFEEAEKINVTGKVERELLRNLTRADKLGFEKLMKENKLDAFITPLYNAVFVLSAGGYPGINVPAGYDSDGAPYGISFGGLKGSEPKLIEIAYDFEQSTKIRKPPPL